MADGGCEIPRHNATSEEIAALLGKARTVAVVGLSPKEERPSHWIALYLRDKGYKVIGVNPGHSEIAGIKVYHRLSDVPEPVDIVNLFIRSENIPPFVDEAIAVRAPVVWMQEGIVNNAAADKARAAGLTVIMNKCIYREHAARG